jgi:hypothetical protein
MTNHGFVYADKKPFPPGYKIESHLRAIVQGVWGSGAEVTKVSDRGYRWVVAVPRVALAELSIWRVSPHVIEMRKGEGEFSSWMQTYIRASLASRFEGKCGDESTEERWDPEPEKYSTFDKWFWATHVRYRNLTKELYDIVTQGIPPALLGVKEG